MHNSMSDQLLKAFLNSGKVSTDTRTIQKGDIFFGLKGESFNGNNYIIQALEKGAALAVTDDPANKKIPGTILVSDSLKTLQDLASEYRKLLKIPVIGITGSNGKTTTKELMYLVMKQKFNVFATHGNLNNHIGVPLSILSIKKDTEIAIIEMGANHIGEIHLLCNIARPTHGIITNLGKAHLEGFGSFHGVIKAKTELYKYLDAHQGIIFINKDDNLLMDQAGTLKKYSYGSDAKADTRASLIRDDHNLEILWNTPDGDLIIKSHLFGRYNFYNILAALAAGQYFKVDPQLSSMAVHNYIPENNRSQLIKSKKNTIYLDAYNANPTSMENALNFFAKVKSGKKVVILGDMLELGKESEAEHVKLLDALSSMNFDLVLLVGEEFNRANNSTVFTSFTNSGQAKDWLQNNPVGNASILIKGSRKIGLEMLTDQL